MASAQSSQGGLELTRLAELITSSVQDVLAEYQNAGQDVPWLSSTEPGPFDKPHLTPPKLSKAIQIIEAACAQLSFAVASPGHVITNVRSDHTSFWPSTEGSSEIIWRAYHCDIPDPIYVATKQFEEPAGLQVVTTAKIADMLVGQPEGLPVEQLAKQSGLDPNKLGRILRMLATKHCFQEGERLKRQRQGQALMILLVKPNVFANNRIGMQLVSTNPVSGLIGNMSALLRNEVHIPVTNGML